MKAIHNQPIAVRELPHVDQYFGAWAITQSAYRSLQSTVESLDLSVHLSAQPSAEVQARARQTYEIENASDEASVAIFDVSGVMMKHVPSMTAGTSTARARRALREAASDPAVTHGLLVIDSPGGSVHGLQDLIDDARRFANKKPLFAYIEDCGCSAGYALATAADKIFINSAGVTGSIGVYAVVYDLSKRAEEDKIQVHVVSTAELKGAGTPGIEISEAFLAEVRKEVDAFQEDFISNVMAGRSMSKTQALQLADGRVHKGKAALELGLIDGVQTLDETFAQLALVRRREPKHNQSKEAKMPQDEKNTQEPVAAKPATAKELASTFPSAPPQWCLDQLSADATIDEAHVAWGKHLEEENAKLAEDLKAQKEAAAKSSPAKPSGSSISPLSNMVEGASEADEDAEYEAFFRERLAAGDTNREARLKARRRFPDEGERFALSGPPPRGSR